MTKNRDRTSGYAEEPCSKCGGQVTVCGDKQTCERCDMLATLAKACPEMADVKEKAKLQARFVKEGRFDLLGNTPYEGPKHHCFEVSYHTIDIVAARLVALYRLVEECE